MENDEDLIVEVVADVEEIDAVDQYPSTAVAVVVMTWEGKILCVHNRAWSCFSLPMTKRRAHEKWLHAALREVAETLNGIFRVDKLSRSLDYCEVTNIEGQRIGPLKFLLKSADKEQGMRDDQIKIYRLAVHWLDLAVKPVLAPDVRGSWLTIEQVLDIHTQPVSRTARFVAGMLDRHSKESGKSFPDRSIVWPENK